MAATYLLKNHKKKRKIALFAEPMVHLRARKFTINANSNAFASEGVTANAIGMDTSGDVRTLCKQGRLKEALSILHLMDCRGSPVDDSTYVSVLQECASKKALPEGKLVHALVTDGGLPSDMFLGNTLVNMYGKCGSLLDARRVLDQMPKRNVVSWTVLIAAYARYGQSHEALALFYQMQRTGIQPNEFTFTSILPACANSAVPEHGKKVHEEIIRCGFESNVFVASALVTMYVKCGNIENARQVFDKMTERNTVTWTVMIAGYAHNGHVDDALKLFERMPERDMVSWTAMIAGYAQNGHVDEALKLFQKMPERDVVSWTAMISGYAQNGFFEEALKLFREMQLTGVKPNPETFASVLPACANLGTVEHGEEIHEEIIRSGFQSNVFVGSALVDMYIKCKSIEKARKVFDKMPNRNVVSWNTMVAGYAQNGQVDDALKLFQRMPERNVISWNSMIAGYAQNGHVDIALKLFRKMPERDVVSWTVMIAGYAQIGLVDEALKLFREMPERNVVSWNAMISGYAQNGHVDEAIKLFREMPERNVISWNTMIAGYAQNGYVDEALKLFQEMPERSLVSWTAIIAAYAQNGHFEESLKLFRQMQLAGVKPNSDTFASALPACANLAALEHGKEVHEDIIRSGFQYDVFVGSALVDMYAKCGSIDDACKVFGKMPKRDVVLWNAMIVGYAMHGYGMEALNLFEQMRHSGTNPNDVTFIGVLSACCHAGLVDDGKRYFDSMSEHYHITPAMEHYCCMVDLLGRAGLLDEAQDLVNKMTIKPSTAVWGSLLGACRIHANTKLGESVAERLFEMDPENAAPYVLLSNIYAAAGRWDGIDKVRKMMKDRRIKKKPGCSWIEVNKQVYAFVVGDRSHPQMQEIYAQLETLSGQMKEGGYVPDTRFALNDVEEEQKECILGHHSEKLAIAFGLINTTPGTPIRIIKNIRVCGDCHSAIKFISKIVAREIVVRDANRYHHFKDGCCSCGDYW
eukprot:Gb_10324 [translate_table: standard]